MVVSSSLIVSHHLNTTLASRSSRSANGSAFDCFHGVNDLELCGVEGEAILVADIVRVVLSVIKLCLLLSLK